jgi:hypothetical protein
VAGNVMLPMVLRLRAFEELLMGILEAMRPHPGDTDLHAQFELAEQDVAQMLAELRGEEEKETVALPRAITL